MVAELRAAKLRRMAQEQQRLWRVLESHRSAGALCCLDCGASPMRHDGDFEDHGQQSVLSCPECGLGQLRARITQSTVANLEDSNEHYQVEAEDVETMVKEHSFILDFVQRYVPTGRMLDIGCSRGYKLEAARRAGWGVEGIELSSNSARFARERLSLPVHHGTLESYEATMRFDAVIAWHVLEHVPSVSFFLDNVFDLLMPGGCLFVQVPSYNLYKGVEDWSKHPENFCRVHYWYFTAEALRAQLERHSLQPQFGLDDPAFMHLTFVARRGPTD